MTARNNLGLMYAAGEGVPRDGARAIHWLRRPAEEGVGIAQNNLGLLYVMGNGTPPDGAEAARWLLRAAEQGVTLAQENIGALYANGNGVPKDLIRAHMWLNLSRMGGQEAVVEKIRIVERMMTPQDIARATEMARQKYDELRNRPPKLPFP